MLMPKNKVLGFLLFDADASSTNVKFWNHIVSLRTPEHLDTLENCLDRSKSHRNSVDVVVVAPLVSPTAPNNTNNTTAVNTTIRSTENRLIFLIFLPTVVCFWLVFPTPLISFLSSGISKIQKKKKKFQTYSDTQSDRSVLLIFVTSTYIGTSKKQT